MGRHSKKAVKLLSFHGEGEANGPGFYQTKAWQRRDGVFLLVGQFVIQHGFQTQQMIFCGQHLEKQSVPAEDPAEFLRQGQGEETGQGAHAALLHRDVGGGGAEPGGALVFSGGAADGLLGDVQPGQGCAHGLSQPGRIVPLPAAHVQDFPLGPVLQSGPVQLLRNGGIEPRLQKGPAGEHLLPGVPGGEGVLLLHRQKVYIPLAGDVEAVVFLAAVLLFLPAEALAAEGADQFHSHPSFFFTYCTPFFKKGQWR